jgi:hypothetical protein
MTPEEIAKEAEDKLKLWPPLQWLPEWHPYYWKGRLDAAKEAHESKNREGNQ